MKHVSKKPEGLHRPGMRRLALAIALTTTAVGAHAAGLGRLNLMSGIGQPLRAEIELTAVTREEAGSLTARLASPDAFGQAGIEYGSALTALRFSIQRRASGLPYVLVTSNALVNDPYLDVLVELTWSSGRLVREYTMLLDPPETRSARTEVDPGQSIIPAQSRTPGASSSNASRIPSASATQGAGAQRAPSTPSAGASAAASRPASPSSTSGSYVVQNGDTAMSIARSNKPDAVSLDQMLAALYRDNPQAFSGNINRLMAGATVKLPDASAAQALDGAEARRVIAQSANFGRYRERLAQNAVAAPAARNDGQPASGKLSTQVQDNAAPAADARDRLQLSRPDASRPATAATGARSGTGAGVPTAEELAAKDRELIETRSRLAQLEKSVGDLQQLLKLKNQTLADLQKGAGSTTDATRATQAAPSTVVASTPATSAPTPATPPAAVATTGPAAVAPTPPTPSTPPAAAAAPTPTDTSSSPTAVPAPTPAPAKVTKPAPIAPNPATAEGAWYDSLLDNTLLLAGLLILAVLILGYVLVTMRRRRKLSNFEDSIFVDNSVLHANSVFGTTGGQSVDTANSGFHSNFVPVAGNLPEQNEVDPVAEADVYIAYGRDAQAEEILKEALRADGSRQAVRLKLLEIYAKRGDTKTFETVASELYAATGGQGDDWHQAAALGLSIDPRNPLYADSAVVAAPAPVTPPLATGERSGAIATGTAAAFAASGLGHQAADEFATAATKVDHTRTDPMPRAMPLAPAAAAPSMDLDFDLGLGGNAVAPLNATTTLGPTTAATPAPTPVAPIDDDTFDFDSSASSKSMIDPFTASAFGGSDASARTAVNLPAFRAHSDQAPPAERPAPPRSADHDGFSASDIFGSSIIADTQPLYSETPPEKPHDPAPPAARTSDFRNDLDAHAFDKTEPLDAFSKINLDLDNDGYGSPDKSDFGAKTEVWQAMATKLDLALAYSDIGDKDGARELLEEVVRNGDQTQSDRAKTMIGQLD